MLLIMRGSRRGTGVQTPHHKKINGFSNTGPDPPENSQHPMTGHHWPARETPYKWRFPSWQMMAPAFSGILDHLSLLSTKQSFSELSWTLSDKIFWIRACLIDLSDRQVLSLQLRYNITNL